jgi:hypothetical protein
MELVSIRSKFIFGVEVRKVLVEIRITLEENLHGIKQEVGSERDALTEGLRRPEHAVFVNDFRVIENAH